MSVLVLDGQKMCANVLCSYRNYIGMLEMCQNVGQHICPQSPYCIIVKLTLKQA